MIELLSAPLEKKVDVLDKLLNERTELKEQIRQQEEHDRAEKIESKKLADENEMVANKIKEDRSFYTRLSKRKSYPLEPFRHDAARLPYGFMDKRDQQQILNGHVDKQQLEKILTTEKPKAFTDTIKTVPRIER